MVKTMYILPENFGDSSYIQKRVFTDVLNQFQMLSLSPAHNPHRDEYIEGGDFHDSLRFASARRSLIFIVVAIAS
ncbi:hypothetical protein RRG12_09490 [Nostoc sp. CALU 546]